LLCGVAVLAVFLTAAPAGAQTTKSRLDEQQKKLSGLKSRAGRLAEALAKTEHELDETRGDMVKTRTAVRRAEDDMAALQDRLKDRIRAAYRMRGIGFFHFLLEARSFSEFNQRMVFLQRQTLNDEGLVLELRKKRHELELHRAELNRQENALQSRKGAQIAQARQMTITLTEQNRIYQALKTQFTREQLSRMFRTLRGVGGYVIPLDACPVAGPHNVTNSFGAPRGGGTRRHQGNDIMAPYGAPVVAVVSGRITKLGNGGNGGISVYLYGNGTEFYYAHLSRRSVGSGQSVSAGQSIGANGDTGNARGGAPHVHFEIHPGGGRAIDPYPSLSRVC
jgi:murein DD-endopeptidase MepM/ murein hydrolase activator NlpD